MSSILAPLLPDELIWSLPGRLRKKYPSLKARGINDAYNVVRFPWRKSFPCSLAAIANSFTYKDAPSGATLAYRHTFLPFARPLMSRDEGEKWERALMGFSQRGGSTFLNHASVEDVRLRSCPHCMREDRAKYGSAYWHRLHQLPLVTHCSKHRTPLVRSNVVWDEQQFIHIEDAAHEAQANGRSPDLIQEVILDAYRDLAEWNGLWPDRSAIFLELARALRKSKASIGNGDPVATTLNALALRFGKQNLDRLAGAGVFERLVESIIRSKRFKGGSTGVPHLALICALGQITLTELLTKAANLKPETGPWPCKAPAAPCSGRYTIVRMLPGEIQCVSAGKFICPECGTSYLRHLPLETAVDGSFHVASLKARSEGLAAPWGEKLKRLWLDPMQTWQSIAQSLNQEVTAVKYQASRLGLHAMPGRTPSANKRKRSTWLEKKTEMLDTLSSILAKNPLTDRRLLAKDHPRVFNWFQLNDPEPLHRLSNPDTNRLRAQRRLTIAEIDQRCADRVLEQGRRARATLEKESTRRVTVGRLRKAIFFDSSLGRARNPKLVLTRKALTALADDTDAHFERIFAAMCASVNNGYKIAGLSRLINDHLLKNFCYNRTSRYTQRIRDFYEERISQDRRRAA